MKFNLVTSVVILIVILFIAVGVQTYRANLFKEGKEQAEDDRDTAIGFANSKEMETERYNNSYNNAIARTKVIEISLANVQALRNTERLAHLKQFEGLKKKLNNLNESISIDSEINEDSIPVSVITIPCADSIKVFHYQLVDEWNTISAMVIDTPKFEIKVPIRSAVYWQRKHKVLWWRMGRKEFSIDSYSPNKLVEIKEQELIRVTKK